MNPFTLEHSKGAYFADFAAYAATVVGLAASLVLFFPLGDLLTLAVLCVSGLAAWTLAEYVLHRFVLHGLPPFRDWHQRHHGRPTALISTPTLLSASLIGVLITIPAWLLGGRWVACALTLGVSSGYLVYTVTHHATHHWRPRGAWLLSRKRWHARHHLGDRAGCYGVTGEFWDRVFGTATR